MSYWRAGQELQNGKYVIEEYLGGGGFGVTYRAKNQFSGNLVAIKTLNADIQARPDFDKHQERFVQEAFRLTKCSHPHVVVVDDVYKEGELWCMVMEYITGRTLEEYLLDNGVLSEEEALRYIQQIGEALIYVHQQGFLHRDVKPGNIMLHRERAILIDFGLAREFISDSEQSQTEYKTERFAPIEQYSRRAKRGAYTDVYALAATLYNLLTDELPPPANLREEFNIPVVPPVEHNSYISDRVNKAILKGMALEPVDRPQSVQEWLKLLLPPPPPPPPPLPPQSRPQPRPQPLSKTELKTSVREDNKIGNQHSILRIGTLKRRSLLKLAGLAGAGVGATFLVPTVLNFLFKPEDNAITSTTEEGYGGGDTIKVGILHSLSGTMAISETTLVDAEMLAIKDINKAGGVLGKQIEPIKEDGASDWPTFAEKAAKLIDKDDVVTIFGCWTSASRKSVLPVFEYKQHMLWYPVQYEGQECSQNVFYTGATPNQQIEPAVDWLLQNKGKNFFLVGSDYVFPRTANTIIKEQLKARGGKTVGEDYLPLGNTEVTPIITKIKQALPNGGVIFNSLNGDSNVAFFKQIKGAGLTPDKYPVMSVSIAEEEVRQIGKEFLIGHYAAWNYFQTVDTPANKKWVEAFKAEYGQDRVTNDPMEAAYIMVYLWKHAVEKAGTTDLEAVRKAAIGQTFDAPEGKVTMNANHHLSKTVRIGQVRYDGLFHVVWSTDGPVDPLPWNQFVPQTKGYACDWTDPARGGKYRIL